MIANMSKEGKHISMDTLARICETLNCEITDVIELVPDLSLIHIFKELQTVKRNIDQILRREEPHRRKEQSHER